jgi:hypothetical protein
MHVVLDLSFSIVLCIRLDMPSCPVVNWLWYKSDEQPRQRASTGSISLYDEGITKLIAMTADDRRVFGSLM